MSDNVTVFLRGKAYYPKILGDPVLNFQKDGKEWTLEFEPSEEDRRKFKTLGIADRLKTRENFVTDKEYITLRQRELRADGTKNKPIKVKDINGQDWDKDTKIGNGSVVDVKLNIKDYGKGRKKGVYLNAVRVLDLVAYSGGGDFPALSEDDEFFASDLEVDTKDVEIDDLDDNLDDEPF